LAYQHLWQLRSNCLCIFTHCGSKRLDQVRETAYIYSLYIYVDYKLQDVLRSTLEVLDNILTYSDIYSLFCFRLSQHDSAVTQMSITRGGIIALYVGIRFAVILYMPDCGF
jgi:hypothetical protein